MPRAPLLVLPLLLFAAPAGQSAGENELDRPALLARLKPGATKDEVRKLLGPPRRVARQILYQRHLEQWVYDRPAFVHLEFDCPRGREAQLTTIRPLWPR